MGELAILKNYKKKSTSQPSSEDLIIHSRIMELVLPYIDAPQCLEGELSEALLEVICDTRFPRHFEMNVSKCNESFAIISDILRYGDCYVVESALLSAHNNFMIRYGWDPMDKPMCNKLASRYNYYTYIRRSMGVLMMVVYQCQVVES